MAMAKKISWLIVAVCTLVGIYLRLKGTWFGFFAFTFDQGRDFLLLNNLVYQHDLTLIGPASGIEGVFHGVWWYWFLAPVFWIAQGNPRTVFLFFGILMTFIIPLVFILGKRIADGFFGLIQVVVVTQSYFYIGIAAQIWNPNVAPLFTAGLLIAVWNYFRNRTGFVWIGVFLGLIFEFGIGYGGLFLLSFIVTLFILKISPNTSQLLKGLFGFFIWLIPRFIFEARHNFIQVQSLLKYLGSQNQISNSPLIVRIGERLLLFYEQFIEAYGFRNVIVGSLLLVFTIGMLYWWWNHERNLKRKFYFRFLFVLIGFLYIFSVVYPQPLWSYYLTGLPVLFLPCVSLCWYELVKRQKLVGSFLLLSYVTFGIFVHIKSDRTSWVGDAAVYKNQIAVVDAVYQEAQGEEFVIQVYSPSVIDYTYQYLFLWYGEKTYGFVPPRQEGRKLVFSILEPERWNPKIIEAWLREREGDGTIVWDRMYPGEIRVQKRIR